MPVQMLPEREGEGRAARQHLPAMHLPEMRALKIGGRQEGPQQGAGGDCR